MFRRKRKGLSILEIIGVAVLIGLFSTMAVWSLNGMSTRNKEQLAQQRLETTAIAIRNYFVDRMTYPSSLQELTTTTGSNGLPYLSAIPEDPFSPTGAPIQYDPVQRKLWSVGHKEPIELKL